MKVEGDGMMGCWTVVVVEAEAEAEAPSWLWPDWPSWLSFSKYRFEANSVMCGGSMIGSYGATESLSPRETMPGRTGQA